MTGRDAIKSALQSTQGILNMYLSDFSDGDLLVRPVPNANHIAWQLGHLIQTEVSMTRAHIPSAVPVELPAGFKEQHDKATAAVDPPKGFLTKSAYVKLFGETREATITTLNRMSDADLDKPTSGEMAKWFPTVGALFLLHANHTLMHAGQFSVVRRKLGKPILF